jgi:hypothetical protein
MTHDREFADVNAFFARYVAAPPKRRSRVAAEAPVGRVQEAALHHTDPFVRRDCLGFLDHYANDQSAEIFALALADPVEPVRHIALHSIACETCRTEELCVSDVVPSLVRVLVADPSPELRHKTIAVLLRLAGRHARARAAVEKASRDDPDPLVREVAARSLSGDYVRPRKAYERRERRHGAARSATRTSAQPSSSS